MKNLSTFSKSIVMAVAIAGAGTATIVASQAAITNGQVSEAVAAVQSKISLQQAIAIGNKTVKGDLVSVEFDQNDYSAGGKYEIKTVASNTEYEIKIDANTGKVLSAKQEQLDKEDMAEYNAMKRAKVSLNQAMQTAAQSINGKVIEAEFDVDNGKSVYEIKVAKGNQVHKVVIDSMTGKVMNSWLEASDD
ncbi:PepSY domain-containing protein [Psychrobacter sp. 72-O-c]|uniref:PepSY domain-containing protein n=1 Tax=Psychrobacter sp. 72-O-c TaxID=2774125 RepID=UPI001919653E|nr:PepSY domain-containing protein [Psychrobacter sp. 72-O-c]